MILTIMSEHITFHTLNFVAMDFRVFLNASTSDDLPLKLSPALTSLDLAKVSKRALPDSLVPGLINCLSGAMMKDLNSSSPQEAAAVVVAARTAAAAGTAGLRTLLIVIDCCPLANSCCRDLLLV